MSTKPKDLTEKRKVKMKEEMVKIPEDSVEDVVAEVKTLEIESRKETKTETKVSKLLLVPRESKRRDSTMTRALKKKNQRDGSKTAEAMAV